MEKIIEFHVLEIISNWRKAPYIQFLPMLQNIRMPVIKFWLKVLDSSIWFICFKKFIMRTAINHIMKSEIHVDRENCSVKFVNPTCLVGLWIMREFLVDKKI